MEKTMRKMLLCLMLAALAAGIACAPKGNPAAESAASEAAQNWLALVDAGNYAESWDQSAQIFRSAVSRDQWQQTVQSVRGPLGTHLTRELLSKKFFKSLPGAPDGEYVVILFTSSFQNKQSALETVTPMLDKDGTWRVSGYYIK
jgi:ribosomal protein S12 methylthiotransferase accessory factor YcaO